MDESENLLKWKSKKLYLIVFICQVIGSSTTTALPATAIRDGAVGVLIVYVTTFLVFGIPLLYMEFIISQFTSRDCVGVWKARPFLSHTGYIIIIWQIIILIYAHVNTAFSLHYTIISFETPIPFYMCGSWSDESCNILVNNHTVAQNCIKEYLQEYCYKLYETYPEYQYWRNYLLQDGPEHKKTNFSVKIAWRVCLPSGFACALLYLSAFKRQRSLKYFMWFFFIYPSGAYLVLFIVSLLQKGVVTKFSDAMDINFATFFQRRRLNYYIVQIVYTLTTGCGVSFNLASGSGFRAPNYANLVVSVVICAAFTILSTCTTAMIFCPYAYEYSILTDKQASKQQSFLFEKVPRLMNFYSDKEQWLVVIFSSNAFLDMRITTVLFYNLQEILAARYTTIAKYPGVCSLVMALALFLVTILFLGPLGMKALSYLFNYFLYLTSLFIVIMEILVFVIWYGVDRFCEDVHFMQGVKPGNFMKLMWIISSLFLSYVFLSEVISKTYSDSLLNTVGAILLGLLLGGIILIAILKLVVALFQSRLKEAITLDPQWGPRSVILQRSRAMFTGQAMTKEYLYRQYHLQAGILARQKRSNVQGVMELSHKDRHG